MAPLGQKERLIAAAYTFMNVICVLLQHFIAGDLCYLEISFLSTVQCPGLVLLQPCCGTVSTRDMVLGHLACCLQRHPQAPGVLFADII